MNIPVIKKYEMENLFLKQYLHVYEENKQTNKQTNMSSPLEIGMFSNYLNCPNFLTGSYVA